MINFEPLKVVLNNSGDGTIMFEIMCETFNFVVVISLTIPKGGRLMYTSLLSY